MLEALILDGHSPAAMEATQSLGRAGVAVSVSSDEPNPLAFSSRYTRYRLDQPAPIPTEPFLDWLRALDTQHQYQLIIPSTESALQAFLGLPADSPLRRRAVLACDHALATALDRRLTWKIAAELDVPIPGTAVIDSLPAPSPATPFPLVLKPARSKVHDDGELKTFAPVIVRDAAARESVLQEWVPRMPVLEQEYVGGWGLGIELLYREGKLVWYFAHERLHEWPLTGGASSYRRAIEPPPQMLAASRRLLDSLRWHGVAMVEFKRRHDGSFALMEINPRLWGSLALSIDAGVDFPLGLWKIAAGERLGPQPSYRRGLRTRLLSRDIPWQKGNFLANHDDPLLLTRPRLKSVLEPLLVLTGCERWDHFSWRDPVPFLRELRRSLDTVRAARSRQRQIGSLLRRRSALIERQVGQIAALCASRQPSILFVCDGNICRSPFAALLSRSRLPGYLIRSAGLDRRAGRATPPNVAHEAARLGYDMSACRSMPLTAELLSSADFVCVMDVGQYNKLAVRFPECMDRVLPLGLFATPPAAEIEDPNLRDVVATRRILLQIASAIDGLAKKLNLSAPGIIPRNSI